MFCFGKENFVNMQLTVEQRVFVVTKYLETKSYNAVREAFTRQFPQRNAPTKKTIYKNVKKYQEKGTSLNLNKERYSHRKPEYQYKTEWRTC